MRRDYNIGNKFLDNIFLSVEKSCPRDYGHPKCIPSDFLLNSVHFKLYKFLRV